MQVLLFAETPTLDPAYLLAIASRCLHTLAAAVLFGGLVYLRWMVVSGSPAAEDPENREAKWFQGRRARWARTVALATAVLLVSGSYNAWTLMASAEKLPGLYHVLFGIKFLISFLVFFLAAALAGKTTLAVTMRTHVKFWLNICLLVTMMIFVLAAVLRSLH